MIFNESKAPSDLTLSDHERSKSRSLAYWGVGDLYVTHRFSGNIKLRIK